MIRARLAPILALLLVAEIVVFVLVGNWIGVGPTILLALLTSAVGLWLFGREGSRALRALGEVARAGRPPGTAAADAGLIALGGLLVFVPGFVTDLAGLLCLMPATRPMVRKLVIGGVARKYGPARVTSRRVDHIDPSATSSRVPPGSTTRPEVIEGEIVA